MFLAAPSRGTAAAARPSPPPPARPAAAARRRPRERVHLPAAVRAGLDAAAWPGLEEEEGDADADDRDAAGGADADVIAAVVTGAAAGAVSIVRLSGPGALAVAARVFAPAGAPPGAPPAGWAPASHRVYYGEARAPDGGRLDEVLALAMRAPRSYTAEDVVELHAHGGGVCAGRVLAATLAAGARRARPGEFTLRAFLNGRLDLAQAEAVGALVSARTPAAADSALAGLGGGLGAEIAALRAACLGALAELDARLDFDEDLPPLDEPALLASLAAVRARVDAALATARAGRLLRAGLQVALVGRPNVGKSSLLNALAGAERAIVSDLAGTTRDVVEAGVVVGGVPLTLLDTAGVRAAPADRVEAAGVARSLAAAGAADLVVMVADAAAGWGAEDAAVFAEVFGGEAAAGEAAGGGGGGSRAPALLVLNKGDLAAADGGGAAPPAAARAAFAAVVRTSAATGEGLEALRGALLDAAGAPELAAGGLGWAVNERQGEALLRAREALARVAASAAAALPHDFWTIDLSAAVAALGEVSGAEVGEEALDAIFSKFCIGK
jgi:tRNA modification GTPase